MNDDVIEQAARVLEEVYEDRRWRDEPYPEMFPVAAQALADAGLLRAETTEREVSPRFEWSDSDGSPYYVVIREGDDYRWVWREEGEPDEKGRPLPTLDAALMSLRRNARENVTGPERILDAVERLMLKREEEA